MEQSKSHINRKSAIAQSGLQLIGDLSKVFNAEKDAAKRCKMIKLIDDVIEHYLHVVQIEIRHSVMRSSMIASAFNLGLLLFKANLHRFKQALEVVFEPVLPALKPERQEKTPVPLYLGASISAFKPVNKLYEA